MPDLDETGDLHFVLLSSVIHAHSNELFPGMKVKGCYQFRVTRNADMFVDEEEVEDLLKALKGQLHGRNLRECASGSVQQLSSRAAAIFGRAI